MKSDFQLPLPIQTIEEIYLPWIQIIKRGESGTVWNISKRHQLYRVHQFVKHEDILSKHGITKEDVSLVPLDITSLPIEEPEELSNYLLSFITSEEKQTVFLIIGADMLLSERAHLLALLDSFRHLHAKVSYLFFMRTNICLSSMRKKIGTLGILYQNITYVRQFTKPEMLHFIHHMEGIMKGSLSEGQVANVVEAAGSEIWLTTQGTRLLCSGVSLDSWQHDSSVTLRLSMLWEDFLPIEQTVLKKIANKGFDFNSEEHEALEYLIKSGWVEQKRKVFSLTVPLLQRYIQQISRKETTVRINDCRQIIVNDVIVDAVFSSREKKLIQHLIQSNTTLSREKAAEILWDDSSYSDWALDMAISRIRKKCNSLGLGATCLKTIRNVGFQLDIQR